MVALVNLHDASVPTENIALHPVHISTSECPVKHPLVYKSAGFFEEGKRRECLFKDDTWWDEVHLGILKVFPSSKKPALL
jgi:hypothetical protein